MKDIAIVFDCGATNVRVIAIDVNGKIISSHSTNNETSKDTNYQGGKIWDLDLLWNKLSNLSKKVMSEIDKNRICGVTFTTFGVDGSFVDKNGKLLYPVISWQCNRTLDIVKNIDKYISIKELYKESGVYPFAFNTIFKLIWLKENKPEIIKNADKFLFIPSLLMHKLTGVMKNDFSMCGTGMICDLKNRKLSDNILSKIGIDTEIFGELGEAGDIIGHVSKKGSNETDIPQGIPVVFTGHDTQYAIYGSGANENQPILSSGTWEILMCRSKNFSADNEELKNNITTEADSIPGLFNIGQNWLASGILEWFAKTFYPELSKDKLYETMIKEASEIKAGANGISVNPNFYAGESKKMGEITGLSIDTKRSELYRAFIESLAYRMRRGLESLEKAGQFKADKIIIVGGGSKNMLWNQIKSDVCNLPIQTINQKETTVLGASLFVFAATKVFNSVNEARNNIDYKSNIIYPSNNKDIYNNLYKEYLKMQDYD